MKIVWIARVTFFVIRTSREHLETASKQDGKWAWAVSVIDKPGKRVVLEMWREIVWGRQWPFVWNDTEAVQSDPAWTLATWKALQSHRSSFALVIELTHEQICNPPHQPKPHQSKRQRHREGLGIISPFVLQTDRKWKQWNVKGCQPSNLKAAVLLSTN